MDNKKIRVALTHGDTNGIGYELIFKAFSTPAMFDICTPIIYGSPKIAAYHCDALGLDGNTFSIISNASEAKDGRLNLLAAFDDDVKVDLGMPSQDASRAAIRSIDRAITDFKDGLFDVLVMAPVEKENMHVDGFDFPCNEKFIESCMATDKKGLDILVSDQMRLTSLTCDMALRDVPVAITAEGIIDKVAQLYATLRRDFSIEAPRIAVLALNPNDTESHPQKEEQEIIVPAIQKLSDAGVCVFGPYQSEEFFGNGDFMAFDGILSMYEAQGAAPMKALCPDGDVHYLAGLPIIGTSPDMSPRYDIAGQGKADVTAMRNAIYLAIDCFRRRNGFDAPYANPLQKLYKEKKDESEKVRFAIPKKRAPQNGPQGAPQRAQQKPAQKPAPKEPTQKEPVQKESTQKETE
jgi:4-hydroxythreonine-4-phosphate dehydrogenase